MEWFCFLHFPFVAAVSWIIDEDYSLHSLCARITSQERANDKLGKKTISDIIEWEISVYCGKLSKFWHLLIVTFNLSSGI